jgi:hypothetical protein
LYALPNIIKVDESRRMRRNNYGEMRKLYKILIGKPKRRDHSEDIGVDGRIILEFISDKEDVKVWTEFI